MTALQQIPRTLDAIKALPSMQRYRIALQIGAIPAEEGAMTGFSVMTVEEQSNLVLRRFQETDAVGGPGSATAPQAAEPPPRQPAPAPSMGAPAPMGAPGAPGTQMGFGPPPMGAPSMQFQPPPQQYPQSGSGVAPVAGMGVAMGAPVGMAPPQMGAPPAVPRTPQTSADSGMVAPPPAMQAPAQAPNGAGQASGVAAQLLAQLLDATKKVQKTLDEEVPGIGDLDPIMEMLAGINRTQQTVLAMLLLVFDILMPNTPREVIARMVKQEVEQRTAVALLHAQKDQDPNGDEGKG